MVAAGIGSYIYKSLPPYRAVWKKLPPKRFGYESFHPSQLTCDWKRNLLFDIRNESPPILVQSVELHSWEHQEWTGPTVPHALGNGFLLPASNELCAVEHITGHIHCFNLQAHTFRKIDHVTLNQIDFTGVSYMNNADGSVQQFAGYGNFKCHNQRRSFNFTSQLWSLITETSQYLPYPRYSSGEMLTFHSLNNTGLYIFGGRGNPSGVQSEHFPHLNKFDGNFYPLNDLWLLDFASNQWQQVLKPQIYNPIGLKAAICHPATNSVLFLCGSEAGKPQQAHFSRCSGFPGDVPKPIPNSGDTIEMFQFWCLLMNPASQHLMVFANEGVYDVQLVAV